MSEDMCTGDTDRCPRCGSANLRISGSRKWCENVQCQEVIR